MQTNGTTDNGFTELSANNMAAVNTAVNVTRNHDTTNVSTERKVEISPDTIMKYVIKDSDKPDTVQKSKGHSKNSLRRRRSTEEASETRAPLIVNYETAHTPAAVVTPYLQYTAKKGSQNNILGNLGVVSQPFIQYPLKKTSENFVQASDLADFSLQTLHERPIVVLDPVEVRNLEDTEKKSFEKEERPQTSPLPESFTSSENDSSESSSEVRENNEKNYPRENYKTERLRKPYDKTTNSGQPDSDENSYKIKPKNDNYEDSKPSYRKNPNDDSSESNEGGEKEDYKSHERSSSEESSTKESQEEYDNVNDRIINGNPVKANLEDNSSNSNEEKSSHSEKSKPRKSYEQSGESEEKPNYKHNVEFKKPHYDSRENDEKQEYRNTDKIRKPQHDSTESDENTDYREIDKKSHYDSRESDEKQAYRSKDEIAKSQHDSESHEKPDYRETSEISKERDDIGDNNENPYHRNKEEVISDRDDIRNSGEELNYSTKSNLQKDRDDSREINENPDYKKKSKLKKNIDVSEDSNEKSTKQFKSKPKNNREYIDESDETSDYSNKGVPKENPDDVRHYDKKPEHGEKLIFENPNENKNEDPQGFTQSENPLTAFSRDITESEKNNYRNTPEANGAGKPSAFKPKPFGKLLSSLREEVDGKRPRIQDVDLRDFSYERVKLNEKGVVEPIIESKESYEKDSSEDASPPSLKPDAYRKNSDYTRKTNEGEIKPVVEISNESNESSEEKDHDRPPILYPIDDDKTVESFEKSKSGEIENKAGKKEHQVSELKQKPENVKEDFERIPLNYNHEKNKDQDPRKLQKSVPVAKTPTQSNDADQEDEVDYTPPAKEIKYDEKLNFKFEDTPIKLPEIRLPEDILAFNYKEPIKKNQKFYHKDSEENVEESNVKREEDDGDNDDDTHYGPYKSYYKDRTKDNYEKNPEEDHEETENDAENEDLYEKFVRERFGKQDSFKQRSEKLQQRNYVPNAKLYETIDKILKKTEDTEKQAAKSGDPNAGYMWTLEYGENLR